MADDVVNLIQDLRSRFAEEYGEYPVLLEMTSDNLQELIQELGPVCIERVRSPRPLSYSGMAIMGVISEASLVAVSTDKACMTSMRIEKGERDGGG